MRQTSPSGVVPLIKFVDMFSGIGGFREGLTHAGGFECVGHCEIDKYANRSYNALFDTKGEWFIEDARKADPSTIHLQRAANKALLKFARSKIPSSPTSPATPNAPVSPAHPCIHLPQKTVTAFCTRGASAA